MRYLFLNRKVKEEVTADPELFLVYRSMYGDYDPEIDPLHNPDWVARKQAVEKDRLEYVKGRLALAKKELAGESPDVELLA